MTDVPDPPSPTELHDRRRRLAVDAARELIALVPDEPIVFSKANLEPRWQFDKRVVLPAMLFRAVGTIQAICVVADTTSRVVDAETLLRTLCDSISTLAWIAADPNARISSWERRGLDELIKMEDHTTRHGRPPMDAAARAKLEERQSSLPPAMPDLASRAKEADRYWTRERGWTFDWLDQQIGFDYLYAEIFRELSGAVHGSPHIFWRFVSPARDKVVVHREPTTSRQDAYVLLPFLSSLALYLAAPILPNIPKKAAVNSVLAPYVARMTELELDLRTWRALEGDLSDFPPELHRGTEALKRET